MSGFATVRRSVVFDQASSKPFSYELGDGASREQRKVIRVRLNGREHLPGMGSPCQRPFDHEVSVESTSL
jgi:hypothetical protein